MPANVDSNWHAYRLPVARGFAAYLHTLDPVHQVPAADLLPQETLVIWLPRACSESHRPHPRSP